MKKWMMWIGLMVCGWAGTVWGAEPITWNANAGEAELTEAIASPEVDNFWRGVYQLHLYRQAEAERLDTYDKYKAEAERLGVGVAQYSLCSDYYKAEAAVDPEFSGSPYMAYYMIWYPELYPDRQAVNAKLKNWLAEGVVSYELLDGVMQRMPEDELPGLVRSALAANNLAPQAVSALVNALFKTTTDIQSPELKAVIEDAYWRYLPRFTDSNDWKAAVGKLSLVRDELKK